MQHYTRDDLIKSIHNTIDILFSILETSNSYHDTEKKEDSQEPIEQSELIYLAQKKLTTSSEPDKMAASLKAISHKFGANRLSEIPKKHLTEAYEELKKL